MAGQRLHVAYRAVLLAAGLVVAGLVFRELATLALAVVMTVILAIPLAAAATRLERRGVPRAVGAFLGLAAGTAVLGGLLALVIPAFVAQVEDFVDSIPAISDSLRDITGLSSTEMGDRVQRFVRGYTNDPLRLIGPVTTVGTSVASILGALLFIVITAFYIAVRPQPLVDGLLRLVPPEGRDRARHVLARVRTSWIGWLRGVAVDMVVSGVLLYVGLTLAGLDYALVFAVVTALLVVIPYFGSVLGAIPPVLLALADSPGRALVVLAIYVAVQQLEGNVIVPLVMSRTVRLHPAAIAVGVVMVGGLFGFVGLFVAVPLISLAVILAEELWVRPQEERARAAPSLVAAPDGPRGRFTARVEG